MLLDCHVLQSTQIVEQDETDLVQLLNPHRLLLQVFRSAPWSKPLHDGFGAAAVRPDFNFERSCSLVFQQVFHVQRFNATLRPLTRLRIAKLLPVSQTNVEL